MPDLFPYQTVLEAPPVLDSACSVLLDFDGTLVEIADRPDAVFIDPALPSLLRRLEGTFSGRLALVSGRSIAQLDTFLGATLEGIAIVGSHGAEIRADAWSTSPNRPSALIAAERIIRQTFADLAGVVIEVKSHGVAVHYRLAPEVEPVARDVVRGIAAGSGLGVQEGKMMIELRATGHDKGTGIAKLMTLSPFAGSVPVFVGDDITDEAGFDAVAALGGMGVLVGPGRATAAQYRIPDVLSVHAWLGQLA